MAKVNIAGYTVSANPTAPNSLFQQDGSGGQGVTFVPKLTETSRGYELSWTNDGGLPNPDPVEITNGTDGTPGTDGENGATFVPSVTSVQGGHKLSWTNDGGLPNPPDVTILDGQGGGGGGILEEFTPATWKEALTVVAVGILSKASYDAPTPPEYHAITYRFDNYEVELQDEKVTPSAFNTYIRPMMLFCVNPLSLTDFEALGPVQLNAYGLFRTTGIFKISSGHLTEIRVGTSPITNEDISRVREIFVDEEISLVNAENPATVKLYRYKT